MFNFTHLKILKTFNFYLFYYAFLAALGLGCCTWGLLSKCCVWTSHCGSFSCCRALGLRYSSFSSCSTWALECVGFSSCSA